MPSHRTLLICLIVVLSVLYGIALFAPAIGLDYSDGSTLAALHLPPARLLRLIPLMCTLLWLVLTRRLLLKMGATPECALLLVVLTAASPTVLYLATGIFPEPLFALLATASLLALLDEKPLIAGLCAGLATLVMPMGAALVVATLLTLVTQRRLRSATIFFCASMVLAAPGLGWSLAQSGIPASRLHLSEIAVLLGNNAMLLAASPFTLLSGYPSLYPGLLTAVALLIVIVRRRHYIPDLFFAFYCLLLLWRTEPPLRAFAPVLPLFLWMLWRVVRAGRFAAVSKATALLLIAPALWFGAWRVSTVFTLGAVTSEKGRPNDWSSMEKLFAFIRTDTPSNAVILADLDPVFTLKTGRKTIRGFIPDTYRNYYAPPGSLVTPEQLLNAIRREHVTYVAVTPDRNIPESASFHRAVAALERGGFLQPVATPGLASDYRLLAVLDAMPRRLPPTGAGTSH